MGTVAIGVLLVVVAVLIAVEVKALLIGQGVESLRREQMLAFLCERPEIDEVFNLLTLHMGPEVMVAIKARMAPCPRHNAMIEAINTVEHDFRARFRGSALELFRAGRGRLSIPREALNKSTQAA